MLNINTILINTKLFLKTITIKYWWFYFGWFGLPTYNVFPWYFVNGNDTPERLKWNLQLPFRHN